jgi:PleD family two-component response regulator
VTEVAVETTQGSLALTLSAGVTTYEPGNHGPIPATALIESADAALRDAKAAGRNRIIFRALGETDEAGSQDTDVTRYR